MRASGSSSALLLSCGFSFREDVELPNEAETEASSYGTRLHEALERAILRRLCIDAMDLLDGIVASLPEVNTDLAADYDAGAAWISENFSNQWQPEVQVAFDWVTGKCRFLAPKDKARDYSDKTATELPGTIDILAPTVGSVTVYDWTTARNYGYKWPQLKLYAMMAARILGRDTARAVMLQVRDGILTEDIRDYTKAELDAFAEEIQFAAATVKGSLPVVGGHCTELYCKLRHTCPAMLELQQQGAKLAKVPMVRPNGQLAEPHKLSLEITGPSHAVWLLGAVDAVDSALTEIRSRLKAYADATGGIPMGNGMVYASTTQKREVAEISDAALSYLATEGKADTAIVTKKTMSWTDLDKTVGKPKAKEIRARLVEMGAVKTSEFQKYETRKSRS